MPRRNLHALVLVAIFSWVCCAKVPESRYSRVLAGKMDYVSRNFYLPVDDLELFEGAMSGMIKALGDEHSMYVKVAKKQEFENDLNQEIEGIGVRPAIDPKTKQFLVLGALPDSPALAAGIRAGDRIERIEGQSTRGLSLEEAAKRIRGKPGTSVALSVLHPGASQAVDVLVVRRLVQMETVEGDSRAADGHWSFLLPGRRQIGYVRITGFAGEEPDEKGTAADLRAALEQLRQAKLRGLVLDLRDNRGGSLKSAVDICDMLVSKGDIVTTRGRDGQVQRAYRATGRAQFTDFPIAVLVNGNSASASEIVAACLQDHDRAIVVGQRSYGKGTVQEVIKLGQALGSMKLTIATYWRPSGQNINRPKEDAKNDAPNDLKSAAWGVSPTAGYDLPVEDEERERLLHWQQRHEIALLSGEKDPPGDEVPDRVLVKAVEYLEETANK